MLNLLTDIAGLTVGHATDLALGSGVTAVLFDTPPIASGMILGGAPGGRDTPLLELEATIERVDAFVLSGGSTFGLDASGGVQAWLREQGRGAITIRGANIPLAPQAILFDLLSGGNKDWGRYPPYRELGFQAASDARPGAFVLGTVGAGTGATTATVKGGLGSASMQLASGHIVAALVAVNAVGSPLIADGPWFWAAPFEQDEEFGGQGWPTPMPQDAASLRLKGRVGTSTTIGMVVTNAALTKPQARRLAIMAHDGLARAILPAHAPMDGDTIFTAATAEKGPADLTSLGHAAALVMARAIARGVHAATTPPWSDAQASWQSRFGAHVLPTSRYPYIPPAHAQEPSP